MIKTTAGVIGPPAPKAARAQRVDLRRNSPSAVLRATVRATSARTRRATIARNTIAMTVRRRASAATPDRRHASSKRNSVTSGPTHPVAIVERSDPTRRVAKVSAKTATGPEVIAPTMPGRRVMATERKARENSEATKSFRELATGTNVGRARNLAAPGIAVQIAASQNRGISATRVRPIILDATRVPRAMVRKVLKSAVTTSRVTTSRVKTAAATNVRAFRAPARIAPKPIVQKASARIESGRSSNGRGAMGTASVGRAVPTGRNIPAANPDLSIEMRTGLAEKTRTT